MENKTEICAGVCVCVCVQSNKLFSDEDLSAFLLAHIYAHRTPTHRVLWIWKRVTFVIRAVFFFVGDVVPPAQCAWNRFVSHYIRSVSGSYATILLLEKFPRKCIYWFSSLHLLPFHIGCPCRSNLTNERYDARRNQIVQCSYWLSNCTPHGPVKWFIEFIQVLCLHCGSQWLSI